MQGRTLQIGRDKRTIRKFDSRNQRKIDAATSRYYRLSELRKFSRENRLTSEKDRLTAEIKNLHEELDEASKKEFK